MGEKMASSFTPISFSVLTGEAEAMGGPLPALFLRIGASSVDRGFLSFVKAL